MFKKEITKNLHLTVGYSCSNTCVFCMESNKKQRYKNVTKFIKSRIYEVLDNNSHVSKVIFTSGEPTLNPQLIDYIKYAKKLKYKEISIISNGRRYQDKKFCLELIRGGVREFIISIHGHNKKIHETLTRSAGSFEQTLEGIKNISWAKKRLPIKLLISHVVNNLNYKHIGKFLELLQSYSIDDVVFNIVQPRGKNMDENFFELTPRYENVVKVLKKLIDNRPELFFSNVNTKKRYLSIIDLPLCLSEEINFFIGFGEIRMLERGKKMNFLTNVYEKTKRKKCAVCKYDNVCEGVYKKYVKNFGWEEFNPVR